MNFERQFDEQVVSNFVREYAAGRTPIPCAHCNSDLKFATLLERAAGFGADAVATGHYARVERDDATGRYRLRRGVDPAKDQSYFLFSLDAGAARARAVPGRRPRQGRRCASTRAGSDLPVADKPTARRSASCPTATTPRSSSAHAPDAARRAGAIVDADGPRARHATTASTASRSASARGSASSSPGAAVRRGASTPATAQVVVGPREALERDDADRVGRELDCRRRRRRRPLRVTAQIRHRHQAAPATRPRARRRAAPTSTFDAPQIAVTPGQAVVFYDGDEVVGGGWID